MGLFNRNKTAPEVFDYIEEHIDRDINNIIEGKPIDTANIDIPEFEEDKVFQALMKEVCAKRTSMALKIVNYAAAVLVLLGLGYGTYRLSKWEEPEIHEIYAQRGDKMIVVLPDGSKVELNSDTHLYYPENFTASKREVRIEGEAFFEITKDEDRPFIVKAYDMMVKVTGTKFNVKAYPEDKIITTTLEEGKVLVGKSKIKPQLHSLEPGESAEYEKGTEKCTITRNRYYTEASSWKNNTFRFRDTQMSKLINTLERKFNVRIKVTDPKMYNYTYNISCDANDFGEIIDIVEKITPVKFVKVGNSEYEIRNK